MAKNPAISTQLKAANAQIAELEKKLKAETSYKDVHYQERGKLESELEQLHSFFDSLPGSIPREIEGSYGRKNSAMTRLAAWLATRTHG